MPDDKALLEAIKLYQAREVRLYHFGEWRDYTLSISPMRYPSGFTFGYVLLLQDITAKKRTEEALYEQQKQMTILEERQRLAQELHDSVNQTLFSAGVLVDLLPQTALKKPERMSEYTRNIQQLIHGATAHMRLILLELHPDAITETDLSASIEQLCAAYTGDTGTPVETCLAQQVYLPTDVQINFYRIAQEALHNIRKHTDATQVIVELRYEHGQYKLMIRDDGGGFVPGAIEGGHFGLGTMAQRAEAIGATFEVKSILGEGTTIQMRWEAV